MSFAPAQPNDNAGSAPAHREITPVAQAAHADIGPNYLRDASKLTASPNSGNGDTATDVNGSTLNIKSGDTAKLYDSVITGTKTDTGTGTTTDGKTDDPIAVTKTDGKTVDGKKDAVDGKKDAVDGTSDKKLVSTDHVGHSDGTPDAPLRSDAPGRRHESTNKSAPGDLQLARSAGGC